MIVFFYAVCLPTNACSLDQHSHRQLRNELLLLAEADQQDRQSLLQQGIQSLTPQDVQRIQQRDQERVLALQQLVARHGWPNQKMVCSDGLKAIFLLVQHADAFPGFQAQMLPHIEAAYRVGELQGQHLALITDRILKNTGKPQRYGTQVDIIKGKIVVYVLENPEEVDKRRLALGLPKMQAYLELLEKVYQHSLN